MKEWKRGIKLIERNKIKSNHQRRDGRFEHVCTFDTYIFTQWSPKLAGSRADTKQGRRIGVESRVLSLINKARGLELPSFSLSLAGNCLHRSISFSTSPFLDLCSSIYLRAFSAHAATYLSDIINISRDLNC